MSLFPESCVEYNEVRKICVAEQSGKSYRLNNLSGLTIRKIKIDGCLAQQAGKKRCDYLMAVNDKETKRAILIELKGGNLKEALNQIYDTVIWLKNEFYQYRFDARIIGTRDVPGFLNSADYLKLSRLIQAT